MAHSGFIGVSCAHLGGDPTVSWIVEIDTGCRGEPTGKTVNVEANGLLECWSETYSRFFCILYEVMGR